MNLAGLSGDQPNHHPLIFAQPTDGLLHGKAMQMHLGRIVAYELTVFLDSLSPSLLTLLIAWHSISKDSAKSRCVLEHCVRVR